MVWQLTFWSVYSECLQSLLIISGDFSPKPALQLRPISLFHSQKIVPFPSLHSASGTVFHATSDNLRQSHSISMFKTFFQELTVRRHEQWPLEWRLTNLTIDLSSSPEDDRCTIYTDPDVGLSNHWFFLEPTHHYYSLEVIHCAVTNLYLYAKFEETSQ